MSSGSSGYSSALDDITNVTSGYMTTKRGLSFSVLVDTIEQLTSMAKSKIAMIRSKRSSVSVADMFDLQMAMNRLTQLSEMSTSVIASMNTAISSMAKNIRG